MKTPDLLQAGPSASVLATAQGRQRLVMTALRLTENTALAPQAYERALLDRFVAGELTIDEVLQRLG
ncbi:hypothetical protein JAO73_17365 [Hymenobacter sp. BT523]|uniref:hypothetical protein n=1 Tax=Hymenobacter sp. BT523 TaxID=2795725 RepID=UPI0018EBC2C0|nr:hypothetical protein [Hymenobacter sp. BT523]MBJ6110797.1 hypothetical protein [Hymenobacter sp. BT523]